MAHHSRPLTTFIIVCLSTVLRYFSNTDYDFSCIVDPTLKKQDTFVTSEMQESFSLRLRWPSCYRDINFKVHLASICSKLADIS